MLIDHREVPTLNTEVTTTLKYLSNVWRSLDFILINFEVELDLLRTLYS